MTSDEVNKLKKVVKNLRTKAIKNRKHVKSDVSHYEGMCKGLWLGYEEAANAIEKVLVESAK